MLIFVLSHALFSLTAGDVKSVFVRYFQANFHLNHFLHQNHISLLPLLHHQLQMYLCQNQLSNLLHLLPLQLHKNQYTLYQKWFMNLRLLNHGYNQLLLPLDNLFQSLFKQHLLRDLYHNHLHLLHHILPQYVLLLHHLLRHLLPLGLTVR